MDSISLKINSKEKGEERNILIDKKSMKVIISVFAFALVFFLGITFHYIQLFSNKVYYEHIVSENKALRTQLGIYKGKFEKVSKNLIDISNYEKKLKSFSDLNKDVLTKPYENISDELKMKAAAPLFPDRTPEEIQNLRKHEGMEEFDQRLSTYEHSSEKLRKSLKRLVSTYKDKKFLFHSLPTLFPTIGWITSFYGQRKHPVTGRVKMHDGIDIGAPYGAQIIAPADGVVVYSGVSPGYGKNIQINHGYGIETVFAHSQKLEVKRGQKVKRGDIIAYVGSTGHSTGPHLHYEVRINGTAVDPYYFLLDY